jgi:hypothetical protein
MKVQLKFRTPDGHDWFLNKTFNDEIHVRYFIHYICRTKNYMLDEIYYLHEKNLWDGTITSEAQTF